MDGKTYLELIEDQVAQLPDANATLQAAMLVVLMNQGGRTLGSIDMAVNFMQTIVTLPENDQWQLLTKLGLKDSDIEGTMAAITGEAIAAGILTPPTLLLGIFTSNQETTQIGEWNPPGKMAGWFYIGNAVHAAIAPEYLEANLAGHIIFTNTTPVDRILAQLQGQLMFKGSRVATALGLALAAHPDSFFTIPHFDGYPAVLIWGGAARGDHRRLAGVRAAPARPGFPRRLASSQSCHPIGRHDSVALDREC